MYSLHPPSVPVNCVDCYWYNHWKSCTKFFVRFMPQINRWFTDYTGFPVLSMFSPSLWWGLKWGMPPGSLPLPPWRRTLQPIFIVRCVLRFLEAMKIRQRFLEVTSTPYRHRIGIHQIRTDPPIATIYIYFFFYCGLRLQVCPCQGWLLQSDTTRSSSFWRTCHG